MIEVRDIVKNYSGQASEALSGVSMVLGDRGLIAICGPAACGKTTLLNILGGIERPDSGELLVDGKQSSSFGEGDWNEYRNAHVGFVFQDPVLVGHRTTIENVELALTIEGVGRSERHERALEALRLLGIESCASEKPAALSGTQQRLVAIARALVKKPSILLVDEPICGLDKNSSETVMRALEHAAQSRLMIMATSNEWLAASYASRVIRLADGKITSDETTGPNNAARQVAGGSAQLSDGPAAGSGPSAKSRRSMPFLSAVSYSIRNISAKKGRAIFTAVASAISMIGIAAIVAFASGANGFIANMENDSIATEPIVIEQSSFDLEGLLNSKKMKRIGSRVAAEERATAPSGTVKVNVLDSSIENVSSALSAMNSQIRDNDLAGFKQFVDSNSDGILSYVDAVQYDYGITPLVYNGDTSHGVEQLNPSILTSVLKRRVGSTTSALNELGGFNEMIDNQEILEKQMDVVYGAWPKSYDECVVVLDGKGGISDLTLYYMGIYDHAAVDSALNAMLNGKNAEFPKAPSELSYEQLMNASFVVLPRVYLYQKNEERGTWADRSMDDDFVAERIAQDGIKLKVSGIVQPKQGVPSPRMSEGVAYTPKLAQRLMKISAKSEITKQQIANPTIDVFTNKSFEDLKAHPSGNLDLDNIITIDEEAIGRLLGMFGGDGGEEAESEDESGDDDTDVLGIDLSKLDLSQFEINERDILDAMNAQRIYDAIALASVLDPAESGLQLTAKQQDQVGQLTGGMVADFTVYAVDKGATAEALHDPNEVQKYWKDYLKTDEGKSKMTALDVLVGQSYGDVVRGQLEQYLMTVYAEVVIDEVSADIVDQALEEIAKQLEKEIERQLPAIVEKLAAEIEAAVTSAIDGILVEVEQVVTGIANTIAIEAPKIIQINLNEEDLVAYLNNLFDGAEIGYDNNMAKLGYIDKSHPLSISIYPKDLVAKQKVVGIIEAYNDRMEREGNRDRTIPYNDPSGDTSQALSAVVDVVGLVLIVLMCISLVVGSIMLVIITCTGVAERRKEIGLLRALGASRGNLMTMFNVETLVEGLFAGVIAVGVVLAASAAVNSMTAASTGGVDLMVLPYEAAIGLIALSGVLPLIAGLVPSLIMSWKRPAQSLRS